MSENGSTNDSIYSDFQGSTIEYCIVFNQMNLNHKGMIRLVFDWYFQKLSSMSMASIPINDGLHLYHLL